MSLQEIQQAASRLSAEDRAKLRAHLDQIDIFSNPEVMRELTESNRQARTGQVHSREEVEAALRSADRPAS